MSKACMYMVCGQQRWLDSDLRSLNGLLLPALSCYLGDSMLSYHSKGLLM